MDNLNFFQTNSLKLFTKTIYGSLGKHYSLEREKAHILFGRREPSLSL